MDLMNINLLMGLSQSEQLFIKLSLANLILVSSNTHNKIHVEYAKGTEEKKVLQKKLLEAVQGAGEIV